MTNELTDQQVIDKIAQIIYNNDMGSPLSGELDVDVPAAAEKIWTWLQEAAAAGQIYKLTRMRWKHDRLDPSREVIMEKGVGGVGVIKFPGFTPEDYPHFPVTIRSAPDIWKEQRERIIDDRLMETAFNHLAAEPLTDEQRKIAEEHFGKIDEIILKHTPTPDISLEGLEQPQFRSHFVSPDWKKFNKMLQDMSEEDLQKVRDFLNLPVLKVDDISDPIPLTPEMKEKAQVWMDEVIKEPLTEYQKKAGRIGEHLHKPAPELGCCKEQDCLQDAVLDYNGHGHYVCQMHYDSLNRYFDEEYR